MYSLMCKLKSKITFFPCKQDRWRSWHDSHAFTTKQLLISYRHWLACGLGRMALQVSTAVIVSNSSVRRNTDQQSRLISHWLLSAKRQMVSTETSCIHCRRGWRSCLRVCHTAKVRAAHSQPWARPLRCAPIVFVMLAFTGNVQQASTILLADQLCLSQICTCHNAIKNSARLLGSCGLCLPSCDPWFPQGRKFYAMPAVRDNHEV
jgi:hypothetical protein